jgi:hypothetical protein
MPGTDNPKRFLGLLILFASLLIIIYLLREKSPFGGRNSSFAVNNEAEINRIEFTYGDDKLTLEKRGEDWFVNGKSETRKSSIQFILKIIKDIRIKSPVTPDLFSNEVVTKGIKPVRVRIFRGRKVLKTYLVYKTTSNRYGNIMKIRERSKPFIVYIPGSQAEIGSAFNMHELFWQPFVVFDQLPSRILSVRFENKNDPSSSFGIRKENGKFILTDLKDRLTGWDTLRVQRYISYFTHIPFESWAFGLSQEEKEKISSGDPLYRITLTTTDNKTIDLKLWERKINQDGSLKTDTDRLWAKTDDGNEIFIMRYLDVDPVIKKRSYFFP